MTGNVFRPGGLELTEKIAEHLGLCERSSVLDVGCGAGASLAFLCERYGCAAAGIDCAEKAVATARALLPHVQILQADAQSLPFPAGSFDAVLMECSLSLFADPQKALEEARRVLRQGGRLAIGTLCRERGPSLVCDGLISLDRLLPLLEGLGFERILLEDRSDALAQLAIDAIFEFGSLEAYFQRAREAIGGTVIGCDAIRNKKELRYCLIVAEKAADQTVR